eukprot:5870497-Amphidinium_carterae.1
MQDRQKWCRCSTTAPLQCKSGIMKSKACEGRLPTELPTFTVFGQVSLLCLEKSERSEPKWIWCPSPGPSSTIWKVEAPGEQMGEHWLLPGICHHGSMWLLLAYPCKGIMQPRGNNAESTIVVLRLDCWRPNGGSSRSSRIHEKLPRHGATQ